MGGRDGPDHAVRAGRGRSSRIPRRRIEAAPGRVGHPARQGDDSRPRLLASTDYRDDEHKKHFVRVALCFICHLCRATMSADLRSTRF